ncbi:HlyD family type I secretion periplasmic adaptor subunit [Pseudoroseicyclus tamaricis]|uniref:Membrane fusion protein (MFP) family protein n=1 Tax=Pseudoroseicyclus tamaricis TaxID=2705421 RepID=A0A6B2K7B3_9RHOB|nr:HlyD family type I secretion periplasmic adaptor subunit [Pseudoroseicyclus tamaricis]
MGGLIAILLLVGGFGGWAVASQITGAVIAMGRIEVEQNRQIVQHPDGGVVEEILVSEGSTVEAGDLLIRLDEEELRSELASVEGQLFEILARRARFEAEVDNAEDLDFDPLLLEAESPLAGELMDGQRRLYAARRVSEAQVRDQLQRRIEQIEAQIEGIEAQKQAITQQIAFLQSELDSQQSLLDRGLAQSARVLALEREKADLEGRHGELTAAAAQAQGRITETEIEIIKIDATRGEEAISTLRDLQYTQIDLAERRHQLLNRIDRLDIRAPASGVVYGLRVFAPRSVIVAADPLLYVIPQDRPLVITAQVQPQDIDQIFVGQPAGLRFSAFDQRQTPELDGRVMQVSADAFTDEASGLSFYRAEIALNDGEIERLPPGMALLPGMPVEAFIATAARSPMAYFLKPFTDYFAKAFRET